MPPRSVCLNVFTTSLSHAVPKESNVSIKEVDSDVDMKEKDAAVMERARHDSVQSSPNGKCSLSDLLSFHFIFLLLSHLLLLPRKTPTLHDRDGLLIVQP